MYRDPSEFRERFKAYKDGKSVREIYGLPGYEPGKLPVEEMMPYILAVENPTKQGLVNGVWRPPTDSTKWDVHAIGGGLDIREQHNPIVYNYLKTNGRLASPFLTAREEEVLREKVFKKTMLPALQNVYNKYGNKISSKGYARLAGMKWQGHPFLMAISPDSITGKAFIKAIESGDKDLDSVFDAYYKYPANAKRYAARIQADANYWKNHNTVATKPVPQEPIIAVPDATRVATTIPQEKTMPIADPRNATIAEALRAMWAHTAFENMPKVSDMPIWESPSLPALTPVEYDVTPFKYNNGKLPGYQLGKAKAIQQGRKLIPIDKAEAATEPDYNEGWFLTTIKRGVNNAIKTVKDQVRAARNIINGRGTLGDYIEVGIDALTGAAGKLLSGSAKEAKQVARRTLKPTKASAKKFDTRDPNKVGAYYSVHPEEVTPIINNPEVKEVVNFMNNHIGPKYAKQNGVHIGIDPSDINIGYADLSGSNLGGYVGPSGEVVINKDILNDPRTLQYVLGHEIGGHWFDKHYPLTASQMSVVGYGMPFDQAFLNDRPWMNAIAEANAERRAFELMNYFDKGVVGNDLDNAIKGMPMAEAKRYIDRLGYSRGINWLWPDLLPFKLAVTSIPAAGAGVYLAGNEYKNGKLPRYKDGKNPSHAKMNDDGTFTDDYTKVFEDMYVTPEKVDLKRGSHTLNNFPEYLANRTAWMLTFMPQSVLNDKPLEQPAIDPFLLLITGGRFSGDLTGDVIGMGLDKALKVAINSAANAARVAAKTPVGKRTVETIMRTSSNPTPFDKIKNGVKTFDKNRSKAVLNYILTGKRTGNFGYYNSFAETPELAYTGFVSERLKKYALDLDEANIMLHNPSSEYGDAIDAYLYNKQIDPVYGFDLVSIGNDFGPHGQYILLNYNKVSKNIPVYESPVLTIEIRVPRSQTSRVKSIENIGDEGYIRGAYSNKGNVEYDAAGHLKQLGTFANVPMARELDIWKYLPSDYNKYTTDLKGIRKVLQYIGTNAVDAAGTPIIVRTPWQYYPNYSSEFINKMAGYKDGKIAIKPANRGKFNATKKRTGKTTEELTHSKNPLTRKRAIFALNAKKWNHK